MTYTDCIGVQVPDTYTDARIHVVPEADGWSVFIPGLPVSADGATIDEAVTEMVDALRD